MGSDVPTSDREFVSKLRSTVDAYLGAVDRWEAAYQRYYRVPDCSARVSADMEAEQREYNERRRELEALLPRARRLCLKQDLRDPFGGLIRVSLGRFAPQERTDSAIGRGERLAVSACLIELHAACAEWPAEALREGKEAKGGRRSLVDRVLDYFY
jgi:hypothetical protein